MGAVAMPRIPSPLIKPDVRISRIRLSDWFHYKAYDGNPAPEPRAPRRSSHWGSLGSAIGNLMPPTEEISHPLADVVINGPVGPASCSITEVGRPTAQQAVQSVAHLRPWLHVAWHEHVAHLRLRPSDTFRRWTCAQVTLAVPLVAMRSERISEKVEPLRPGVLHRGLHLVEGQPELRHHRFRPRQSRNRISLAEDDEVE